VRNSNPASAGFLFACECRLGQLFYVLTVSNSRAVFNSVLDVLLIREHLGRSHHTCSVSICKQNIAA
jgi:hypothetical protein